MRGLLRPVACTTGGYGVFDDAALQRLCFVRAAFEAGIGLDALARLCRALDAADGAQAAAQLAVLRQLVERGARRWPIWTRNWPPCQPSGRTRRHCRERPDKLPPETRQPVSGYLWGALAVLTCPCHLPILAAVLAGTTAGAFLGEHWVCCRARADRLVRSGRNAAVARLPGGS